MTDTLRRRLVLALLAALFCLMLVLNVLAPTVADDYNYAFSFATGERITSVGQIFPSLAAHGHVMNGRYAPHFFVQLFTMLPTVVFDIVNAAVYLLLIVGLYRLARGGKRWDIALMAAIACAVFVLPPDFGGPMLWLAGACNYLWCFTACVWLMIPFFDRLLSRRQTPPGAAQVALLCALGLFAGNSSENMSAALIVLLCALALILWRDTRRLPLWALPVVACVCAGWLGLVLAPGDSQRIGLNLSALGALMARFAETVRFFEQYLLVPALVYLMLLAFALHYGHKREALVSAVLFAGALLCNAAMTLADYYPLRTLLWPSLLIVAACAVLARPLADRAPALANGAALWLCALALTAALQALPGCYDRYALDRARSAELIARRDAGVTDITTYGITGKTKYDVFYGMFDLTTDKGYVANRSLARELGVDTVVAERFE